MALDYGLLFDRRHPFYSRNFKSWQRVQQAYAGGAAYINTALIRHLSETEDEFRERLARAYYFNHPRKIARLITQYVLATRPERENADPDLCEDWSRTGLRVDEVMRQFSTGINMFGVAWLAVDMPSFTGRKSKADEIREKLRPYCVYLNPLDVLDWCYGADGELDWVLVRESEFDNSDPFAEAKETERRKLWTRDGVTVVTRQGDGTFLAEENAHGLGRVPFIRKVEVDGYALCENHWFEDVVRISDAILNNESEAQMNIIKQMFGLLVVSESFAHNAARPEPESEKSEGDEKSISSTIARTVAVIERPEDKGISRYISPAGVENATIRAENLDLRKMMYDTVGLAISKETRMVESAEAKAWDFQGVEQYMRSRADMLEQSEVAAWEFMHLWQPAISVPTVSYNRNFAVLDLEKSVATLMELSSFNLENASYQAEIDKTAVALLNRLRQLSQDRQLDIEREIEGGSGSGAARASIDISGIYRKP